MMPESTNRGDVAPGATETLQGAQKAVQPAVMWIVSWQAPTKLVGRIPITDGEPGSRMFDTEAEALAEEARRKAAGHHGVVVWTIQEVA